MPNYVIHDRAGYIAVAPLTLGVAYFVDIQHALLFGAFFLISNRWLSPDLDIDSIMIQRWGILYFIWWPYKKLVHHRSVISHSGPLSSLIRILYLAAWVVAASLLFFPLSTVYQTFLQYYQFCGIFYLACSSADLLHTILDLLHIRST